MILGRDSEPQPLVSHVITRLSSQYFTVCSVASILLDFVFLYPIMSIKPPSESSASDEKKKAITLDMKLKIIAQMQANISVTFKVG